MMPIVYFDDTEYESVSDTLLDMGGYLKFCITMKLAYSNKDGYKMSNIAQYKHPSNNYKDYSATVSVNRRMNVYFNFQYRYDGGGYGAVVIKDYNIIPLLQMMREYSAKSEKLFVNYNGKLSLKNNDLELTYFPNSRSCISFSPTICEDKYNNILVPGVMITLNKDYSRVIKYESAFMSLMYILGGTNLYTYASNMIGMFTMNRLGREVYDMESGSNVDYYYKDLDESKEPVREDNEIDDNVNLEENKNQLFSTFGLN